MEIGILVLAVLVGYLVGSISFARLLTRILAPDKNLDQVELPVAGSNQKVRLSAAGATTASIVLGPKAGGMIAVLDIVKGILPTLAFRLLFPEQAYFFLAGGAVVAGHIWPLYHRFRGGWGMSTMLGVFLVLDPLGVLVTNLVGMLLGFFILREYMVALVAGVWLMVPWIWIRSGDPAYGLFVLGLNLMLALALIPEVSVYLKQRKQGTVDMKSAMQATPMGRMTERLMIRFGLQKAPSESTPRRNDPLQ